VSLAPRGSPKAILRGVFLIARGRAEGLNCFGDTRRAILQSLVPGAGLAVAALVESWSEGEGVRALGGLLLLLCVLLAPVVISFELAKLMGREAFWARYVVAFNWCLLLIPLAALTAGLILMPLAGDEGDGFFLLLNVAIGAYALWLHWFIVRHALALNAMRSALFVAGVHLGTMLAIAVPVVFVGGPH
jgi:hypothetical protein